MVGDKTKKLLKKTGRKAFSFLSVKIKIMKDKFEDVELTPKERFIEFIGNAFAIILLLVFFLKIVII